MSRISSITDFPRNEAGLVGEFIGTAYDTVKRVYDNLPEIQRLDEVLAEIPELAQKTLDEALPPFIAQVTDIVDTSLADTKLYADEAKVSAAQAAANVTAALEAVGDLSEVVTANFGFNQAIPYAPALILTKANQLVSYQGVEYRVKFPQNLPLQLSGDWAEDSIQLISMGDEALRKAILEGTFIDGSLVRILPEGNEETKSLKDYVNKRGAVFLSRYMSEAKLSAAQQPDGVDATVELGIALTAAFSQLPCSVFMDSGKYLLNQSNLPNMSKTGFAWEGAGVDATILKLIAPGRGLNFDTFEVANSNTPFTQNIKLSGMTIEGNASTTRILDLHGVARSEFCNLSLREADTTAGVAINLRGVMLSKFTRVFVSTDLRSMTSIPREGIRFDEGRRNGTSVGNSSNNILDGCYFEGLPIGVRILLGDQNTFIGGSPESCTVYGLLIGSSSRYNIFIGTGFENLHATADISDGGDCTQFINCYASNAVFLQGKSARISGGYYERILVEAGSRNNYVGDLVIRHWGTAQGGFFDNGTGTKYGSMYDSQLGAFIYPKKSRTALTPTASPYTYTNAQGVPVEVIIQDGTITLLRKGDGTGDKWLLPTTVPSNHILLPGDTLEISYSGTPTVSRRELNSM